MRVTNAAAALLAASICVVGCVGPDPLGEMERAPARPSSYVRFPAVREVPVELRRRDVPSVGEQPLSLADCIRIALENNPHTWESWEQTRAAASLVGQRRGPYLPQLEFQNTGRRRKWQELTDIEMDIIRTTYDTSFVLRQLLYDGGVRKARLGAAAAALESASSRHNSVLLDAALATEVAYYQLLAGKAMLKVAEQTLRQREHHLELARNRMDAGLARLDDVLKAQAEKAEAELSVVDGRNQVIIGHGRLASVMGLAVSASFEIKDVPGQITEVELGEIEQLLETAAKNRPRLRAVFAEVKALREELKAERASRMPQLNALASYGWRDKHFPPNAEEYTLELGLALPLFTGFQRMYRIRQAEAELKAAINRYRAALQDVELEVWAGYSNVYSSQEAIRAAEKFIASAAESIQATERQYEQGRATIIELIDAQTAMTRAQISRARALLSWYMALARLERAVGRS